mmetsp:Transcript_25982/g.31446  ORF Transcript_25982/g.31446 Transcript_25982/m.31446 type:complete len:539 (+) Transcript_25982:263-1879(+)|eukprot:CAMPEP_0172489204 /NCGR_PEP_ID=MMETSP1066-20121228/19043_1 /TAXON_ID=671091 /ORGANISM="Coscinodiscus wailesii, Strain CCMP2513" /LENGTH=538 /DNA_ID=CAMNT_0013256881 /DNA_START=255 /DNA_END=1874 /DNA_ORIENTATION=+
MSTSLSSQSRHARSNILHHYNLENEVPTTKHRPNSHRRPTSKRIAATTVRIRDISREDDHVSHSSYLPQSRRGPSITRDVNTRKLSSAFQTQLGLSTESRDDKTLPSSSPTAFSDGVRGGRRENSPRPSPLPLLNDDDSPKTKGYYSSRYEERKSREGRRQKLRPISAGEQRDGEAANIISLTVPRSPNENPPAVVLGLRNLGNTCYMNAIVQCLIHTTPFRDEVIANFSSCHSKSSPLCREFLLLLKTYVSSPVGSSISPHAFKRAFETVARRFRGYDQHDAHEFTRAILDGLAMGWNEASDKKGGSPLLSPVLPEKELERRSDDWCRRYWWKRHVLANCEVVTRLFGGQLVSRRECSVCYSATCTFDPFYDVSLPMPRVRRGDSSSCVSLDDCLRDFFGEECLSEEDQLPYCEKCKKRRKSTKRLWISVFPTVFVVHLKRFGSCGAVGKVRTKVALEERLDLEDFAWKGKRVEYELYGVCCHRGGLTSGHYTANCMDESGQWWHFNDDSVTQVDDGYPSSLPSDAPYLLFYKMVGS